MSLKFTTSWDDGSVHDLRVAKLLDKYGMKGTFYIPQEFAERAGKHANYGERLSEEDIRTLSLTHEVGGHTLSHKRLIALSEDEVEVEIRGCKQFLENIVGKEVRSFAYPGGEVSHKVRHLVKNAGFVKARNTRKLTIKEEGEFELCVTVICQPYPFRKVDKNKLYLSKLLEPMKMYKPMQFSLSWQSLARKWFEKARKEGGYFHLYGHSWEIEKYDMWENLESFLKFVSDHTDTVYLTNSEI